MIIDAEEDMKLVMRRRSILNLSGRWVMAMVLVALWTPWTAWAGDLTIAAASDLNFAFKELVGEYEKKTGERVKLTLGSSGNFFSQIQNGAPFDLYFSADIAYPKKLEEAGLTVPGSLYKYAVGRIVVWTPSGSALPVENRGIEVLLDPSVKKIAIANPKHAPYGRAAVSAMDHFKLHERVKDKLVLGENISQTAQFIESGASDVGIIALSLALAPAMKANGKYWEIPADAHPPLEQGAVILKSSSNQDRAKSFLEFLKGPEGRTIMTRYGFTLPS
ncbi:MAG TPA: molybdate ABC transporter substrate-binding protein [Nitrospiraceae bacterium]|nr:molybdate ABC transporter substrate-binding protein [Nitrospiraceae bacterium]